MADQLAERSYTTVDKTGWGDGPWNDEPDKLQWIDAATGLDCLIVRNRMGGLCGYVGVAPEHPWHGKGYDHKVRETEDEWDGRLDCVVEVHGDLTYADSCQETGDEATGICHVPAPGRPADTWWFGFDCGHAFDVLPGMEAQLRQIRGMPEEPGAFARSYKTVGYVRDECARLAEQLNGVTSP